MKYKVLIRNNETGEERISHHEIDPQYRDVQVFSWQENNFACDCNRHTEFLRAGGPGPPEDPHWNDAAVECGDLMYTVPWLEYEDGVRVEIDAPSERRNEQS